MEYMYYMETVLIIYENTFEAIHEKLGSSCKPVSQTGCMSLLEKHHKSCISYFKSWTWLVPGAPTSDQV